MAFFFLLDRLLFYYAHRIYPPPDILPHFGMRLVHEIVVYKGPKGTGAMALLLESETTHEACKMEGAENDL